jgi:hypothetical protein
VRTRVRTRVTTLQIRVGRSGTGAAVPRHQSPPPDHAAQYHILSLVVGDFISVPALGWAHSAKAAVPGEERLALLTDEMDGACSTNGGEEKHV